MSDKPLNDGTGPDKPIYPSERTRYVTTDDQTGEAVLMCEECGETWPESRLDDAWCPDCRAGSRL